MSKVSVIIPIYNVEDYIEECVTSVMKQTLKDVEIICVDDGSTDDSIAVVERLAKKDTRIIIIRKENGGQASARNVGMNVAGGEYIYFLDSDDYLVDNTLQLLYEEAKEYNLDNLYFDAESFFETEDLKKKQSNYIDYYVRKNSYSEVVSGMELLKQMNDNKEFRVSPCLQFLKREFLDDNKLRFEEGFIHEDDLFALEVCLYAQRAKHVPYSLYMRRVRESSTMTGSSFFKHSYGYFSCAIKLIEKLQDCDIKEEYREVIIKRLYGLQSSAIKRTKFVPDNDLNEYLSQLSTMDEAIFRLLIKRPADQAKKIEAKQKEIRVLKRQLKKLKKSKSYKIGRFVTFVPRKVKAMRNTLRKYGWRYIFSVLTRKINRNKVCISIIMPVYNTELYLEECLKSILKQSLKNIEVICVNDGSTDGSLEILREYEAKDKRIKIIDKKNTGAGDCRNIGMKQAKGEYLLFLDSDDIFDKSLCYKAYRQAKSDKADICFMGANRFNMKTGRKEYMGWVLRKTLLPKNSPFSKSDIGDNGDKYFQLVSGCPWSKIFRRKFIESHNIMYQNLKNSNDVYFVRTAMALATRLTYVDETLITYRFAEGDNTQSNKHKNPLEFYKAYTALKERLIKEGIYTKLEKSFVNMVFDDCMFNYRTTNTEEAKKIICDKLVEEGIEFFEFDKYPTEYFENLNNVEEFKQVFKLT